MKKFLVAAGCLAALAGPALSQNYYNSGWAAYDLNGDRRITFAELRARGVRVDSTIRTLDRNNDRMLSPREVRGVAVNNMNLYNTYGAYNTVPTYVPPVATHNYHWSVYDTNRNGVLEPYELNAAGYQTNTSYNMYNIDLNRDGYIDNYEMQRGGYTGNTFYGANNTGAWLNLLLTLPGLLR